MGKPGFERCPQDYVLVKDKLDGMQGQVICLMCPLGAAVDLTGMWQMLMLVLDGHGAVGDKVCGFAGCCSPSVSGF